jgi:S-DNA-T family DNA segregation ATPase FtsK/SpoIIIE
MPAKTNRLKASSSDSKKSNKKSAGKPKNPGKSFRSFLAFFSNRKFHQILGLFMALLAVFLAFSFSSYLATWKADDTVLSRSLWEILSNRDLRVENSMGKIGAILAGLFIKKGFGVASYFFVLWFLFTGIKLVWPSVKYSAWRVFRISFLGLVWFSTAFAYLFPNSINGLLPGGFGIYVNGWLVSVLGQVGTGLILLFVALAFLILSGVFGLFKKDSFSFGFLKMKSKKGKKKSGDKPDGDKYNVQEFFVKDEVEDEDNGGDDEFIDEEELSVKNTDLKVNTLKHDPEFEAVDTAKNEKQAVKENPDLELTIENIDESEVKVDNFTIIEPKKPVKPEDNRHGLDTSYDPRLDLPHYKFPTLDLLNDYGSDKINVQKDELENNKNRIVETLNHYQISIQKIKATIGPTVTLYEIVPAPGVRISKIKNLEDDIALSLSALGIRIIAPIPGKGTIGIEVPNQNPDIVSMKSVLASDKFQNPKFELPFGMGKTIANEVFVADLTKMPHILMAGATGQGKSVGLNAIIASLLYRKHPSELKFIMVDPKKVELSLFSKIERHYLAKLPDSEDAIITDTRKVVRTLNSLTIEMDTRYELLKDAQVRNIKEYNVKFISRKLNPTEGHHYMPYLVLVVDEFADLIMTAGKEIEIPLTRLAQLARAVGIHIIIATQRPSVNIITGSIKANFPARIAFRVTAKVDSRTILDSQGADQLIGRGDMLLSTGSELIRLQCAFIDTPEIDKLTDYIGSQRAYPDAYHLPEFADENDEPITEFDPDEKDSLFDDAARIIVQNQQGSTSLLQRKMKIGYNRAGRIIDQLEAAGIVGHFEGSKARDVLIGSEVELEQFLNNL